MAKSIAEMSVETTRLVEFLESQPPGKTLPYKVIEDASGVKMDAVGKARLRSAMRHARIEYSPVCGVGIKLADAAAVPSILNSKFRRIDSAVRKGERSHKNLQEQFFATLPPEIQQKVLFAGAIFGAIRMSAKKGTELSRQHANTGSEFIPLPFKSTGTTN